MPRKRAVAPKIAEEEEQPTTRSKKEEKKPAVARRRRSSASHAADAASNAAAACSASSSSSSSESEKEKETKTNKRKSRTTSSSAKLTRQSSNDKAVAAAAASRAASPGIRYWLMKSEPLTNIVNGVDIKFGVNELEASPNQTASWEGVRSFFARTHLLAMLPGDLCLLHHSSCGKTVGPVAIMEVVSQPYPDKTAFDPSSPYYDEQSNESDPRWYSVDVRFRERLARPVYLSELKTHAEGALKGMMLLVQSRTSVQPVSKEHWDFVLKLASESPK